MHYKSICDAILSRIRAAINSETFLNQFKEPNRFTRKRLISMYQVIVYLFYSNKAAMGTNISNIRDFLPELDFPKVSRQAVSKARQNIKPALFKEFLDITVRTYYLFTQIFNLWNGYHLFAIDGTRVHMPYSESVETDFGFQGDGRYDRKHFMGLGSVLYDISQDYVVDFIYFILIDFPIFNFADILVTIGTILLFIDLLFLKKEEDLAFLKLEIHKNDR